MPKKRYRLRFMPLFEDDLNEIADYIAIRLHNPTAAYDLVDEVRQAFLERTFCAKAFEHYPSIRDRQYPYYRIYVKNYIIFYVVIDDVMEVCRILYNRRNAVK